MQWCRVFVSLCSYKNVQLSLQALLQDKATSKQGRVAERVYESLHYSAEQ